ncbi:hypothetical protein BX616_002236 [Lobosporangium transversale]|uniref:polynucleotide adenylyltransferase n=1 Tax=Lobosporangium transversale TaxID=64571 RepID=A0A1Y2GZN6_9FUNG|nr:hypothetical protein BCR41DRAFT_418781 [Lobosporangium transversale]KAF9901505.1 hypothetical protein BX616_002236 [Lobosporangium transversale]ORZ27770.1 hypothetical protein BCR41DRAFT_418781 [Lobosporangium transversale]|eukprot:XP_021885473.1 hypothetical protein BCR41DRAFT_418781 [Lobosporangium transversale]
MPIVHQTTQPSNSSFSPSIEHQTVRSDIKDRKGSSNNIKDLKQQQHNAHSKVHMLGQEPSLGQSEIHYHLPNHSTRGSLPQSNGADSLQQNHRPDSPASLEDSQSDSGADPFPSETTAIQRSMPRFSNGVGNRAKYNGLSSKQNTMDNYGLIIHADVANNPTTLALSQVATPPLSPVNVTSEGEPDEEDKDEDKDENDTTKIGLASASSATTQPMLSERNPTQDSIDTKVKDSVTNGLAQEKIQETKVLPTEGSSPVSAATQPIVPASASNTSAWSTLLPGVAPIPASKPQVSKFTRASTLRKPNNLQLHERFPIILPRECEAKLSMDMVDLFESLLPTEESHHRRTRLIKKIERIVQLEWPGQDIQVHPFGSTVNDLGTSSSDIDICIMTTWSGLRNVQMLANVFRKHGMQKVFCIPRAKVPIVKFWDPEFRFSCDMNINTPLGLLNTKMIKTYVSIDPRVRPFAMIIKHWARRRVLNDAANGGTISTYTWICIVINFLQMRSPPILPKLHQIPHVLSEDNQVINGNNTSFCQDLEKLEGFGLPNKETLGGLLYAFFRRFAIEFDYDNYVISVRNGCYLTKESKGWHLPGKQYKLFCVEEPFDTSRNLGNSSDMISSKGLKEEFKRALEILHYRVSLNECCEQYVFPASYYHPMSLRKGNISNPNHYSYAPGRRYANGYRSMNNYYDDDYDDDEEEEVVPSEISVMETLNIGTRSPHSKDPTGSSKQSSSHRGLGRIYGGDNSSSAKLSCQKDTSSHQNGGGRSHELSNQQSQSRNRSKQGKGEKGNPDDLSRSGASRNVKQDKSGGSGSTSNSSQRNKKSNSGHVCGEKQKNGRGNNNNGTSGSGGRTPRAAVEFSLADIANVTPKSLTTSDKAFHRQESSSSHTSDSSVLSTGAGGTVEDEHGNGNKGKRKGGRHNVVWSTNSNRGESSRRQSASKTGSIEQQEKAKVIFMANGDVAKDRLRPVIQT